MDEKVKYNKVNVQFSKIITTLHKKAVAIATEKNSNISMINSAFGESQEDFTGAGEYTLFFTPKDHTEVKVDEKDNYWDFAKEYVKYFVGEDAAKLVTKEDLQPMVDLREPELSDNSTNPNTEAAPTTTNESYYITPSEKYINEAINRIFEEETPTTELSSNNLSSSSSETPQEPEQVEKCVGFYMTYAVDVERQSRTRYGISNALGKLAKGIFGNTLDDLKNLELKTLGGGSIKVGKIFDPETYGLGFKIDKTKIDNEMQSVISDNFPRSEDVKSRVWDTITLIDDLRKQRKLTPEIREKLEGVKYALGVEVSPSDYSYRQFNKQKIADFFNEASHIDEKLTKYNLTEKDIILVSGYKSKYKFDSGYDKKTRKTKSNNDTGNVEKNKGQTVKESYIMNFNDIVVESLIDKLFDDVLLEAHGYGLESLRHDTLVSIISHIPSIKIGDF